eukprot:14091465-Alexandrium_andersonii.AAC.1
MANLRMGFGTSNPGAGTPGNRPWSKDSQARVAEPPDSAHNASESDLRAFQDQASEPLRVGVRSS